MSFLLQIALMSAAVKPDKDLLEVLRSYLVLPQVPSRDQRLFALACVSELLRRQDD